MKKYSVTYCFVFKKLCFRAAASQGTVGNSERIVEWLDLKKKKLSL